MGGLWLCSWDVIVEYVVVSFVGCVCCRGMRSVMSYVCSLYQITSQIFMYQMSGAFRQRSPSWQDGIKVHLAKIDRPYVGIHKNHTD